MIYLVSLAVIAHLVSNLSGCCFAGCKSCGISPGGCAQNLPSLLGLLVLIYYASLAVEMTLDHVLTRSRTYWYMVVQFRQLFPS
jgi:hypothetical protein